VLDAVNSGDLARVEALVKDAFGGPFREIPMEQHRGAFLGFYDRSRGLDFYGVRRYTPPRPPDRSVVIVKNRLTGGWQGLILTFDGTPEERITGMQVQPARPPKGIPPLPPLTVEQAKAELGGFLNRLSEAEVFSGTALLARNGEVLFEAARGIADRNHGVPMRLESKLNLGSMNKMFTAVVVGQLVDEGKVSFEDPVSKFLGGRAGRRPTSRRCESSTC
jgi:Beta-lactamase